MKDVKNLRKLLGVSCLVAGICGVALAGARSDLSVSIDDNAKMAMGQLGSTFNTNNTVEYIGCNSTTNTATCVARNAAGLNRSCTTTDPETIAIIRSLTSDAVLRFQWETNGTCRIGGVQVSHYSYTRPKKPTL